MSQQANELVYTNVKKAAENIRASDQRFYNLGVLPQLADKLNSNAQFCENCKKELKNLIILSERADHYINDSVQSRKQYEEVVRHAKKHLKLDHQVTERSFYTSLYTIWGLISGTVIGIILSMLLQFPVFEVVTITITIFLVTFRLAGSSKDKTKKKQGKQL